MKVAIFCVETCSAAIQTIKYFREKGFNISLIIIETAKRKKFSASEQRFRAIHEKFKKTIEDSGTFDKKQILKILWSRLSIGLRAVVRPYAHLIPFINRPLVKREAERLKIPVVMVKRHSSQETRTILEEYGISHVLLISSGWLIKEPLLSMKDTKIINVHCAKLPQHRSLDSFPWSIIENDQTGSTAHYIDAGIDTGPILFFTETKPQQGDNLILLRSRIDGMRPKILFKAVLGLRKGTIIPFPQNKSEGIHHRPMTLEELLKAEYMLQERIRQSGGDQ